MYFSVNEFEVSVNDSIFSGNEQQKVYYNYFYSFMTITDQIIQKSKKCAVKVLVLIK